MKRMLTAIAFAALALGAFAAPASADVIDLSVTGIGNSTTGDLLVTYDPTSPNSFGGHSITGVTGTFDGANVTGLIGPQNYNGSFYTDGYVNYDNTYFSSVMPFDNSGLYFTTDSAALGNINLYYGGPPDYAYAANGTLGNPGQPIALKVAQVPEPLTLSLFGAGLVGIAWLTGRRNRKKASSRDYSPGRLSFNSLAA